MRDWESCERTTRPKGSDIDGVGIVAILNKSTGIHSLSELHGFTQPSTNESRHAGPFPAGPEIILQKQYRPPVDKVCIEVPAGLVDEGETAEQAAVRELKEETGYVGKVTESTPVMFNGTLIAHCPLPIAHCPQTKQPNPLSIFNLFIPSHRFRSGLL